MHNIRLESFIPDGGSRASHRLSEGALTVTVTSKATMRHVTLRFRCRKRTESGKWITVPFQDASHVFIEDYDWESLATLYPANGVLRFAPHTSEAARWCVLAVLDHTSGNPAPERVAEITPEDVCIRCSRPLTDPESIERGYGPECFGLATSSSAVSARDRQVR